MNGDEFAVFLQSPLADEPPVPAVAETVARVRRRVTAARLRVAITAVAAIAVIAGVLTGGVTPWHRASVPFTDRIVNGFPEFIPGYRIVTTADATSAGTLTVTVKNTNNWLRTAVRCPTLDPANYVFADLAVDGMALGDTQCDQDSARDPASSRIADAGIPTGETFELTVHLSRATVDNVNGPPGELTSVPFSIAVYQPVRFAEVPLPKRPDHLKPLNLDATSIIYRSDDNHPDQPIRFTTTWHRCTIAAVATCLGLSMSTSTPGEFVATINDTRIAVFDAYDYGAIPILSIAETRDETMGPTLANGATITIVVTPEGASGPWAVQMPPAR